MGRLRVPIDRSVSLSFVLTVVAFVVLLFTVTVEGQKKLVLAKTDRYATTVVAKGGVADATVSLTDVLIGGGGLFVPANGAAIRRDVSGSQPFALIPAPETVSLLSVITYRDEASVSSFSVPPIGAVTDETVSLLGPIVSDEEEWTVVNVFPTEPTPVQVRVLDGNGQQVAVEEFDADPPVTQYHVKAKVAVGFLQVRTGRGAPWFCFPRQCSDLPPLYGFAVTSVPSSANMRVFPF